MKTLLLFLLLLVVPPAFSQADTSYYRPAYRSYADSILVLHQHIARQDTTIHRQHRQIQLEGQARQHAENSSVAIVASIIVGAIGALVSLFAQ